MKIEKSISIYVGGDTRTQRSQQMQEKQDKKGSSGSISAKDLNIPQDNILQKKKEAQQKALKVVTDAWGGDKKIDADVASRMEKIAALEKERGAAKEEMAAYEAEKETIRESYGVEADSEEQKDLELLLKQRQARRPGSGVTLTEEEEERLSEIDKKERTEYQSQILDMDKSRDYYRDVLENCEKELKLEKAIVRGIALERLKKDPMVGAKKEADAILESANKEVIGMLMDEAKDHIDEEQEEKEEKAEEIKEKKEAEEKLLEKQKDKKEEAKERAEELADSMPLQEFLELEQSRSDVQKEVQDIVNNMKLVAEDIKGAMVDNAL